jgi:hypothetical protein
LYDTQRIRRAAGSQPRVISSEPSRFPAHTSSIAAQNPLISLLTQATAEPPPRLRKTSRFITPTPANSPAAAPAPIRGMLTFASYADTATIQCNNV